MANQPTETEIIKAATAGFAQSLINHGIDEQTAAAATLAYAHPENGLLVKRAANLENMQKGVNNIINALRAQASR